MKLSRVLLLLALAGLSACGTHKRLKLAQRGQIQPDAPLQARTTAIIAAPADQVWAAIADIKDWPQWQTNVRRVAIRKAPAVKVPFAFTSGLWREHGQIVTFQPDQRLVWVGRVRTAHTIHIFNISRTIDGTTSVQLSESVSGWPVAWFTDSTDLLEANQQWLVRLKRYVERKRT